MQRIVNCLTKLFLQILNFLFEIAVVRYRKQNLGKEGLRIRDVWLTALSVSRTTATSSRVRGICKVRADMESAPTVLEAFCCQERGLCGQLRPQTLQN